MRAARLIGIGAVIRLPSEAEWEYCARAGTNSRYSFGDDERLIDEFAWHTGNAAGNDPPVGAKKPNPWGLYDMHGYLWEFCSDHWNDDHANQPADGSPRTAGGNAKRRVLRSGSWKTPTSLLASAARMPVDLDSRDDAIGLRCVLAEVAAGQASARRQQASGGRQPTESVAAASSTRTAGEFKPTAQDRFFPAGRKPESLW